MAVKIVEVGDYDRNRKSYCQDSRQDAKTPQDLPSHPNWHIVAVSHCCHGNDGPPEGVWDGREHGALLSHLQVENGTGVDDGGDAQEEDEHTQLANGCLHSLAEDLESLREMRKLDSGLFID